MKAIKSIKQSIPQHPDLIPMMDIFRKMVNHCIQIGLENNCSTIKKLSTLVYCDLQNYDILPSYKLNAVSQACNRLAHKKQSIKRGKKTKSPYVKKQYLTNCYGIKRNGMLLSIPYKLHQPINILLNQYTVEILSDHALNVRSFSLTTFNINLYVSKEIKNIECSNILKINRNLNTCVTDNKKLFDKTNKSLLINKDVIYVKSKFKRSIHGKNQFYKEQQRRISKTIHLIHQTSKEIVQNAIKTKLVTSLKDLKISKSDGTENNQENKHERHLDNWQLCESKRQIKYKVKWDGIQIIDIDSKCIDKLCPTCGKRIQEDKYYTQKSCSDYKQSMYGVATLYNIVYNGCERLVNTRNNTNEMTSQTFGSMMKPDNKLTIQIADTSRALSKS